MVTSCTDPSSGFLRRLRTLAANHRRYQEGQRVPSPVVRRIYRLSETISGGWSLCGFAVTGLLSGPDDGERHDCLHPGRNC
jgi:hypothetical protein